MEGLEAYAEPAAVVEKAGVLMCFSVADAEALAVGLQKLMLRGVSLHVIVPRSISIIDCGSTERSSYLDACVARGSPYRSPTMNWPDWVATRGESSVHTFNERSFTVWSFSNLAVYVDESALEGSSCGSSAVSKV